MVLTIDERVERKLARIETLREKRTELVAELARVDESLEAELGETTDRVIIKGVKFTKKMKAAKGPRPLTALDRQEETKTPERKKGQKVCKICQTPGHIAKTCPQREFVAPPPVASGRAPDKVMQGNAAPTPSRALSGEEYGEVRVAMQDRNFMSASWALAHKMSPKEVNKAVRSSSYAEYIDMID